MVPGPVDGGRALLPERLAARLVRRIPGWAVLLLAAGGITAVAAIDYEIAEIAGYDFVVTPLFLVPVGLAAWAGGARTGYLHALYAASVEATVMWARAPDAPRPVALVGSVSLELVVFLGMAYTVSRLRWHLAFERLLSRTDPVTGIGNLRTFEEAAAREIARVRRRPGPLSVAYFDVDHFKEVNDRRGHADGDRLLRAVGQALRGLVRSMDTVARVGGDEFVLLLPESDAFTCRRAVERLRGQLTAAVRRAGFENTFSVGAVTFETPPRTPAELLSASDRVMYLVKRGARDGAEYEVVSEDAAPAAVANGA